MVHVEMRGISGKYVNRKRVYLGRGINHIDRTACCLGVEDGCMGYDYHTKCTRINDIKI
jgi:hypothetical protein